VFKQQHCACRRMHTLIRPRMHLPVPLSLLGKKNIKNCNSKTVCSTTTLRTFTMMCPPFHLKFLHSDFKSFNEPHIICGLSVTLKPTWCTSKLVYKTTTSRVLADAYAHPTSYAFACSALPPRTTIYT
jgi:hypothetical protein